MSLLNDLDPLNHRISLSQAVEMTTRFRTQITGILKPAFALQDLLPISETFKKSIFSDLAAQPGCVAIRTYLAMDDQSRVRLIFVGVDNDNHDIISDASEAKGLIFEYGQRCPPICSVSPLSPSV